MSLGSYSKFAGVVSLIGLLSFAPEQAQQKPANEAQIPFIGVNDTHQVDGERQPGVSPGSLPTREAATPADAASESRTVRAVPLPEPIAPLAFANQRKLTLLDKAYLDAFSILREDSACSRFYGGPPAIAALNQLTLQLIPTFLDRTIALRMNGRISFATNHASGFSYRVFEKAELNLAGPFYASSVLPNGPRILGIGEFFPNTREARVTILLHELGHMVEKGDRHWALPDDGGDIGLSRQNTQRVLSVCGEQIRRLGKTSFAQQLSSAQAPVKPDRVSGEIARVGAAPLAQ